MKEKNTERQIQREREKEKDREIEIEIDREIETETEKNIIREYASFAEPYLKQLVGPYQQLMHGVIAGLGLFVMSFTTNLNYLSIVLLMLSLDALTITILHNCPLTLLEQKYLKRSAARMRQKKIQTLGIVYKCNHLYESQLEFVINASSVTIFKILAIIVLRMLKDTKVMDFIKGTSV